MNKKIAISLGALVVLALVLLAINYPYSSKVAITSNNPDSRLNIENEDEPTVYACNADGKICWDGSMVGRTGPNCEFVACPAQDAASAEVLAYMGGTMTALNISVTPKVVVSDSRCPVDVVCVWAGTVEVRTVIASKVGHGEHILKLGVPQVFGDYNVTLIEVTPAAKSTVQIPESSYRFKYKIEKR